MNIVEIPCDQVIPGDLKLKKYEKYEIVGVACIPLAFNATNGQKLRSEDYR